MINPYAILNVHRASTPEEIKASYYARMKQEHPDAGGTQENAADISAAYKILTDKSFLRQHFDELSVLAFTCPMCSGKGFKYKQKSLTERITSGCKQCGGQGYLERS